VRSTGPVALRPERKQHAVSRCRRSIGRAKEFDSSGLRADALSAGCDDCVLQFREATMNRFIDR
jgi:hypothetical protein